MSSLASCTLLPLAVLMLISGCTTRSSSDEPAPFVINTGLGRVVVYSHRDGKPYQTLLHAIRTFPLEAPDTGYEDVSKQHRVNLDQVLTDIYVAEHQSPDSGRTAVVTRVNQSSDSGAADTEDTVWYQYVCNKCGLEGDQARKFSCTKEQWDRAKKNVQEECRTRQCGGLRKVRLCSPPG